MPIEKLHRHCLKSFGGLGLLMSFPIVAPHPDRRRGGFGELADASVLVQLAQTGLESRTSSTVRARELLQDNWSTSGDPVE